MLETSPRTDPDHTLAPHPDLPEFYDREPERAGFVRDLFDGAAGSYDWLSGLLSFGTDRYYRRDVLRSAGLRPGVKVLDVATGTGLVAQAAFDLGVGVEDLVGLDPSRGMLGVNRGKRSIRLVRSFGEALPFRDESFDFISMGYALRHVSDLAKLFREFRRVLRPGGQVVVLEISRPVSRLGFALMRFHMRTLVPWFVRFFGRGRESARLMEYYWATIAECVPPGSILGALNTAGFERVRRRTRRSILSEYLGAK